MEKDKDTKSPLALHALDVLQACESVNSLSLSSRFTLQKTINIIVQGLDEGNTKDVLGLFIQFLVQDSIKSEYFLSEVRKNLGL